MNKFCLSICILTILFAVSDATSGTIFPVVFLSQDYSQNSSKYCSKNDSVEIPEMTKDTCESIDDLSILSRREVRDALFIYLTSGREYTLRAASRAVEIKPLIEEIFAENTDIPYNIIFLPILESGYSPFAVSRMKAVGLWQIIAPTAKALGLKINQWIDERRDIKKSTAAAIKHLRDLRKTLPNWDLALAAYNCGTGRVSNAMRKHKSSDFWHLAEKKAFRKETTNYLPQYAALALIFSKPELFDIGSISGTDNLTSDTNSKHIRTESFILKKPAMISEIASRCGIKPDVIYAINPELIGRITPPTIPNYEITIPEGTGEYLSANESELYHIKISYVIKHTVRKGESVSKISQNYGVNPELIISLNGLSKPYLLRLGQTLYIPRT